MKKISLGIIVLATFLTVISPAIALTPLRNGIRKTIRETVKEEKKEGSNPAGIKEDVKEIRMGLLDKIKNFMKKNLKFEARVKGKITVVGSNNFSLNGDDGTFQVNINDKTKFLRKFGGKSSLGEYSVGDEVIVFGKFTDDTKLIIDAKTVKNNSIQKRFGAFFGKITVKNIDNFIMETAERGTQTVYFGTAKIVNRKETNITLSDIKVGDRVRVKGVWDKTLSKIAEVIQIKDFSIPVVIPTQATEN
ncbi:hypothetical protein COW97_00725 [Candidatus Roizmanbacteria bacterium CG22_combo_CG10-13_8_21_14_all_34_12]|uniref:DUF5666 domain-containing protein n=1 Tax=Candidatus Roizmanbacteria bacterium CG22_combo_CG10-13_8_21_14_all_34_12 TaxID=1974860 RepID=A0A2H0C338_9BACT|nr:MAG: hypothetical protein COW97_00725 [Candidatus Roizmanbacteria bacterium CG22_combo_CG10-13_8_21_14_all_34_12]